MTPGNPLTTLSGLTQDSYPPAHDMGEHRLVRRWIVRTRRQALVDQLEPLAREAEERACKTIRATFSPHVAPERLEAALPVIGVVPISSNHIVVAIETANPEHAIGDDAGIATWVALRCVDEALEVEDLQGLPRDLWFQFAR